MPSASQSGDAGGDLLGGEIAGQLAEGAVVSVVVHPLHWPKR